MVGSALVLAAAAAWTQFGFGPGLARFNPAERTLAPANVAQLAERWSVRTGGAVWSSPVLADGVVYVGSNDGYVYALRSADGQRVWRSRAGGRPSAPAVAGGLVVVRTDASRLVAFDRTTGRRRWTLAVGPRRGGFPSPPTVAGRTVYADDGRVLVAADAVTGRRRWRVPVSCFFCPPAVAGGEVYVESGYGRPTRLEAFAAATGKLRWAAPLAGQPANAPAISGGNAFMVTFLGLDEEGGTALGIQAVATSARHTLWSGALGTGEAVTPAIPAADGARVYVAAPDALLHAFDVRTGASAWATPVEPNGSSPAVANGVVYVGSGAAVVAVDAATGAVLWSRDVGATVESSPSVAGAAVLVGDDAGVVHCFALR